MDESIALYPTMLSSFIKELQEILDSRGDMPVAAGDINRYATSKVHIVVEPYYYDSGILYPTDPGLYHNKHWMSSKTNPVYAQHLIIDADGPCDDFHYDVRISPDTIDGVPLPKPRDDE